VDHARLRHTRRARHAGLIGASVFRGLTGFGADDPRSSPWGTKGPCAVVIVDEEPRTRSFLPQVADVLGETAAVAALDRVRIHTPHAHE
jgi:PII-like signaling protein